MNTELYCNGYFVIIFLEPPGFSIYGVLKLKECARAEIMKQLEYLSMIRQRKSIDHTERVRCIGIC